MAGTRCETFDRAVLAKFRHLKILEPEKDLAVIEKFKDGSFGFGMAAFALYANGFNPRGRTALAPCGLLFHDGKNAFGVGYYRKEGDLEGDDGYLMVIAPKGQNAARVAGEFARAVINDKEIPCKGAYIRFLQSADMRLLERLGFEKVGKKHGWNEKAPLEDETYKHSSIRLANLLKWHDGMLLVKNDIRLQKNRFENFLARNGLTWRWEEIKPGDYRTAEAIIGDHFSLLERQGKRIGSMAEDYYGLTRMAIGISGVDAKLGYVANVPVSAFISETISPANAENRAEGMYCTITLRDEALILQKLGLDPEELVANQSQMIEPGETEKVQRKRGVSAIAQFFQLAYLAELAKKGMQVAKMGGSETHEHDTAKARLGAGLDTTVWAFLGGSGEIL